MQFGSLALLLSITASVASASACQNGSSGLAKPADLLKMVDNCQITEMSESLSDAAACNAAHMKEIKSEFQAKASKLHLKGRRSNKAHDELKQLDTEFGKSVDAMTKLNSEIGEAFLALNKKLGATLKEGEKGVTSTVSKAITKGQSDLKKGAEKVSSDIKNGTETLKEDAEKEQKKAAASHKKVAESFKAEQTKNQENGLKTMEKVCKDFKSTDLNDIENEFKNFGKSLATSFKDFKPFAAYFNSSKVSMESFEKSMTSLSSEVNTFSQKMECDLKTVSSATQTLIQDVLNMASTKVEGSPASALAALAKDLL